MRANRERACPHCGGQRQDRLVPRNYLCAACQGPATDVLGRKVRLFNGLDNVSGVLSASGLGADHEDGTACAEVVARSIAYVNGTAYRPCEGRFGRAFLSPLPEPAPQASVTELHPEKMDLY
ncbi:hypothetical protein [Arthrobacter sp. Marseille-P9274]|uniref:hypothetical protein n=1 Tax=Arthrobacter sp. Marseille-P9274 TaxID=2866572 RepID=UPI0021C7C10F|nr:hypothetical protein [Arthrobacter sp. Marseille-P9274]